MSCWNPPKKEVCVRCRRPRPSAGIGGFSALAENPDAFSFPSGHTCAAFAAAIAIAGQAGWLAGLFAVLAFGIALPGQYGQQGIGPQLIMIIEIFIAECQGVHPLGHQFRYTVLNTVRGPVIPKATSESFDDPSAALHLPQEQTPAVRTDLSAVKACDDFSRK